MTRSGGQFLAILALQPKMLESHTSQDCSNCGEKVHIELYFRIPKLWALRYSNRPWCKPRDKYKKQGGRALSWSPTCHGTRGARRPHYSVSLVWEYVTCTKKIIDYLWSPTTQKILTDLGLRPGIPGVSLGAKFSPEYGVDPNAKSGLTQRYQVYSINRCF